LGRFFLHGRGAGIYVEIIFLFFTVDRVNFWKKSFGTWRKLVDNRREIFESRRKKGNFGKSDKWPKMIWLMLKIRPLMICKESPENAVAGWGERNKQKHSAKRKEKGSFFFVVINGRIFIMAGTDRFVITRRRHPWHSSTPL
jgi:hypothetical protein